MPKFKNKPDHPPPLLNYQGVYACEENGACGYLEDKVDFKLYVTRIEILDKEGSVPTYELRLGDKIYGPLITMKVKLPEKTPVWGYYYRYMTKGQSLILEVTYTKEWNEGRTDTILLAFDTKEKTVSFLKQLSSLELDTFVDLELQIEEIAQLKSKDVLPQSKTSDFLQFNSPFGAKKRGGGRKKNKTKKKRNKSKKKSKKRRKSKSKKRRKSKSK